MVTNEEILIEIKETRAEVRSTHDKLWGEDGFEGDIPEIKRRLGNIEKSQAENDKQVAVNANDIKTIYKKFSQFPVNIIGSKIFWVILLVMVLALAGMNVVDIQKLMTSLPAG